MSLRLKMALLTAALVAVGIALAGVLSVFVATQYLTRDVRVSLEQELLTAATKREAMLLPPGSVSILGSGPATLPSTLPGFGLYKGYYLASVRLDTGAILVAARPQDVVSEPTRRMEGAVWRVGLVVGLAGALAAFAIAGRALLPLQRMAVLARRISTPEGISQEESWPSGSGEVGELGTALSTMLARLAQAFADLEASQKRERQFLADAGHDLRTPLTIIRGNVEIAAREDAAPDVRSAALHDAATEAARLSELMEHLLILGPLSEGKLLSGKTRPLDQVVEAAVARWRPRLGDRELSVDEALPDDIVPADLDRVLDILLDNALKYGESGPVAVHAEHAGAGVVVEVSDRGRGIAEDELPYIFDRFYRSDRARQRGGFGLGLAIAKAIVTAAGGSISAASVRREGTTMRVELPPMAVAASQNA